jgi:predicted nucleic acid-binding protein
MNRPTPPPAAEAPPLLVLDTNVVLDWLVFCDPRCSALSEALTGGRAQWVATQAMRDELERVLRRGSLDTWHADMPALWTHWDRWASIVPPPQSALGVPRCTDPDDQKFIDLAIHLGASALLSRDRAVLRCARGARTFGLTILTPDAWARR